MATASIASSKAVYDLKTDPKRKAKSNDPGWMCGFGQLLATDIWSNVRFMIGRYMEESKYSKSILRVGLKMFKNIPRLQQQSLKRCERLCGSTRGADHPS